MANQSDSEVGTVSASSAAEQPPRSKYDRLIAKAQQVQPATTVVAHPCDESSLRGAIEAAEAGIIVPILVGPAAKISAVAKKHGIKIDGVQIVDAPDGEASSAAKAVEL